MNVARQVDAVVARFPEWVRLWWSQLGDHWSTRPYREQIIRYISILATPRSPEALAVARMTAMSSAQEGGIVLVGPLEYVLPSREKGKVVARISGKEVTARAELSEQLPAMVLSALRQAKGMYAVYTNNPKVYVHPILDVFYPLSAREVWEISPTTAKCFGTLREAMTQICNVAGTSGCKRVQYDCEFLEQHYRENIEQYVKNTVRGWPHPDCLVLMGMLAGVADGIREECPIDDPIIGGLVKRLSNLSRRGFKQAYGVPMGPLIDDVREVLSSMGSGLSKGGKNGE
ncbi:MAG: hypothetical protein J7K48_03875 [Thermococcus sp.]|nr:hypothetical protein [Thermococcus sp.]